MELNKNNNKPTVFSGVQPSGILHLGNYLGALVQWVEMQDQYNCIFSVVDYHAITIKQNPEELKKRIINVVKMYLASGINPEKAIIFQQSAVSAHTELAWILNCVARIADLNKMTQFKEKAGDQEKTVSVGLYDYPILMAADILLYNTDIVPVGDDQIQHVELTRTLARRFNREYGQIFKVPEVIIKKQGARIMGLDDPTKKMSKSAGSPANYIALTDSPEVATKKIMRAVTDSDSEIKYDLKKKPAIANLMTIYSLLAGLSLKELEQNYKNKGYGDFKKGLAQAISKFLTQFQIKYNSFTDEKVKQILKHGADKIRPIAEETLKNVKNKLGII
ncbi:tryptophan--tRNA ligase [Patescibacteria group bacterium]|nr:tryptophan--tRNA ligase [Patescibacteria group bacterium]MBU1663028.1 tryptophan--tRNA ligase [Patescibacteria group bacterium]MBU1934163.1 tryptophan--tRNA ligase [Patescibacteria group bacterium]MBU2007552.1 tryptophan--tRNA ligase [Patescibacteria group bacterium]MBU2233496.1 tryptophan--tRNA ligase [Patescibacteria group bacterium]